MEIPRLGLGTWQAKGSECRSAVRYALELGYKHIDTADVYHNHEDIAEAIADTPRDSFWLTTKVWRTDLEALALKNACHRFLKELGVTYLDLLLVHWPNSDIPMENTFKAMKELQDEGKIKHVGVSNFTISHLQKALPIAKKIGLALYTNQVEYHPGLNQQALLDYCAEHDIIVTAYSPLAQGNPQGLSELAEKYGKSPQQICLRWALQKGMVVIPKATTKEHLRENLELDFELTSDEMTAIDALGNDDRRIDPSFAEFS